VNDTERIAAYYDRLVERHGYSVQARDSSYEPSLQARYRVLCEVADLNGKSILEVGCGFGDLGRYIQARFGNTTYVGIDISRSMIDTGRKVHPNLALYHADLLTWAPRGRFDIVLAQGIFYLLSDDAETMMKRLIERMFSLAEQAAAFCTLSAWADSHHQNEFYADPLKTLMTCRTFTPHVVLRHDYLSNDFTIYLHRSVLSERVGER